MDGLDLTVWPCHPVGSWQRALQFQAAGLPVEPADAKALAAWDSNPAYPQISRPHAPCKLELINDHRATVLAVVTAACKAIAPGEVVGSRELARRIAGAPSVPHHNRTMDILKALKPAVGNHSSAASARDGRLYKRYLANLGGRPGHFFARHHGDFDDFITGRKQQQSTHCDAMRAVYVTNRRNDRKERDRTNDHQRKP